MPGIAGVIFKTHRADGEAIAQRMVSRMLHEPFYLSGNYSAPALGFFGGWIALEKSFAAGQPFASEDQEIVLLISGEVYGPDSSGDSLVRRYQSEGTKFFENLNGLYSGLLIDRRKGQAFLFNDRFGFDRVYIVEGEDATYFASEAKALLQVLPELRGFDRDGLIDQLAFGCTIDSRTLFRGVKLLPAASVWTFENGDCRKATYFEPATWEAQSTLSVDEFQEAFESTLSRITPGYFAGEDAAISLTAGLDTRMLLSARPEEKEGIECYTYEGPKGETLDSELASDIARACGYRHQLLRLGPDFFRDFGTFADRAVYLTDGSLGVVGAHEIYFSQAARRISPVRLTGVFGGEILRGVSTFSRLNLAPDLFARDLRGAIQERGQELKSHRENSVSFAAFKEIPWNIFGSVAGCRSQLSFRTPFLDNELVALAYRLPLSERNSAEPAVRFIRHRDPALGKIPTDMAQLGNASALSRPWRRFFAKASFKLDYWNNDGMPSWLSGIESEGDALNWRPPGFGRHKYLRYRRWFRRELRDWIRDRLASPSLRESGIWNHQFLDILAENHIAGRRNYVQEINLVLMIEATERLLFKAS